MNLHKANPEDDRVLLYLHREFPSLAFERHNDHIDHWRKNTGLGRVHMPFDAVQYWTDRSRSRR